MNQPQDFRRRRPLSRKATFLLSGLISGSVAALAMAAPGDRPAAPNAAPSNGGIVGSTMLPTGITAPSTTIKLGFDIRGVVDKVSVKDNDRVTVGQPIISLLDTEERATLNYYRLRADTELQVKEAQETFNVKKIDFERKRKVWVDLGSKTNSSEELEMKTAEAEMNIAQIKVEEAKHDAAIAAAQADAQEARVARMSKISPIDGIIRQVIVRPGEQVDETKPVVEIVDLDPLWIEVTLVDRPTVQKLHLGDKLRVRYPGESQWHEATVDRIDPVSDAGAGTQPFRLSMPNPEMRDAGTRVEIELPTNVAAAQ